MKHTLNTQEKYVVIQLHEEKLNTQIAPDLKAQFVYLSGKGMKNIIVDLTEVKYCDSSGLSAVLVGNRLCKNLNGSFVLAKIQDSVMKLISISQLESVLNIVPTVQEATDLVLMDEIERDIK